MPAPRHLTSLLRRASASLGRALRRRTAVVAPPTGTGTTGTGTTGAGTTGAGTTGTRPPRRVVLPDHTGPVRTEYSPELDGCADPGEIVWTWVPYEEDPAQGKDRPVLVVGWDGAAVLALMLTSKDHTRDAAREARRGRVWLDIGSGPWDSRRRDSEVRLDRVLRLDPDTVRREGAIVDRALFDQVAAALVALRGS